MQNILNQEYVWNVVLGVIASAVGVAALGISLAGWRRRDITFLTFGATSLLYGVRLIAETQLSQYSSTAPPQALMAFTAVCTYIIPVPLSGFLLHLLGSGWHRSMLWGFRGALVFAGAALLSDLILATPGTLMSMNNALVIIWAGIVLVNVVVAHHRTTRDVRVVLFGFLVFGLLAVNNNLVQLDLLPWRWAREELGFVVFLSALGYVAATRFFQNEARLLIIERELEIARQIQSSILPRSLPAVHGLKMTARYVPMVSVAGDFYDVVLCDERRVSILVADVSGHGLGAALIASMLKVAFASQHHVLDDPARVLTGINHLLVDKLEHHFVTAGCLVIDTEAGTLRYAGAGHPPLILHRRSNHGLVEVGDNGLIMGPFPDPRYTVTTMPMKSGDRIILYTDGIVETRNASGVFFGDGAFKAFIETHAHLSTELFADVLLGNLARWSGKQSHQTLEDDLTLLVVDFM